MTTKDTKTALVEMSQGHVDKFKEFLEKGQLLALEIFKILEIKSVYDVSRVKVVGSIGHRNPDQVCNQPDFDLVAFVSRIAHPFDKVVSNFESVLHGHYNDSSTGAEILFDTKTNHSLQFKIKSSTVASYISFGLHPTPNLLSQEEEKHPASIQIQIQTTQALRLIPHLPHPIRGRGSRCYYNCSLAERNIAFVQSQNPFVKDVIRLAQLWNKKVSWSGSEVLYGRCTMIEFVAIAAACMEETVASGEAREVSILNAFEFFLKSFMHLDPNLSEFFSYQAYLNLQLEYELDSNAIKIEANPVNPASTTMAAHIVREIKWAFEFHAKRTLTVIKYYKKFGCGYKYSIEEFFGI